jgi:hypothetical protein
MCHFHKRRSHEVQYTIEGDHAAAGDSYGLIDIKDISLIPRNASNMIRATSAMWCGFDRTSFTDMLKPFCRSAGCLRCSPAGTMPP